MAAFALSFALPAQVAPDLVLLDGRIVTVDERFGTVEALAG